MRHAKMTMVCALVASALVPALVVAQERFTSAEKAARAITAAAAKGDQARMIAILGPSGEEIISSGDPVADKGALQRFARAAAARTHVEPDTDGVTAVLYVGKDQWPFPIPIVRVDKTWQFDTAAGKEELLNRRIGRNELSTIDVCRAYADAQFEFAARFHQYAPRLRSTPGTRDGLYWDDEDGVDPSPLGPLIVAASAEGYEPGKSEGPVPYHGYLFRLLTAQGANAPGGAKSYLRDGKLTDGFALIAWPAEHGVSGVMTFLVNQQGIVFQKDLGAQTGATASGMTTYDPDHSWQPTR